MPFLKIPKEGLDIPKNLKKGFIVPTLSAFTGLKGMGLLAISWNNFNERLVLYDDHIQYKVILQKSARYDEIESVDCFTMFASKNIIINLKGKRFNFIANLFREKNAGEMLRFFASKGVKLTKRAESFLK